jgi:hypothetical protein
MNYYLSLKQLYYYIRLNKKITQIKKGTVMRIILIIAAIVLLVVGILGLFPQFGWANVQLWRSILEIVVGALVLFIGWRKH